MVNSALRPLGLRVSRASEGNGVAAPPAAPAPPSALPEMNQAEMARLLYLQRLFQMIAQVEGSVVECGVGPGYSLAKLSILVREEGRGRQIWGFDSFEGFPDPSPEDRGTRDTRKGDWGSTSVGHVHGILAHAGFDRHFVRQQVTLVKGFFEDTLHKYRGGPIAFLHVDVDLYQSYKTCLEELYPRVAPGGVVLFDEYLNTLDHLKWPGAQKAIDEFLGENVSLIQRDKGYGKYYLIKPGDGQG